MTRRVIAFAVAAYLLFVFIDRFVLVELLIRRVGVPFLLACAVALACIGAGFVARRQRGIAINFAVGYPIFGTICFLVGLLRISAWTMVPLVVIFAAFGALECGSLLPPWRAEGGGKPPQSISIAIVILCGFIAAQAPPSSLDELAYHLAIPWTWVKEARAVDLPLISHSYFPLGVESADLPLFTLIGTGGGIASHFLHLFLAIATIALISDSFVAAAIVTAPVLAITAGWSLVDWNLLAVSLALLRDDDDRRSISAALAAGLLTKYTFIPIALIVLITRRRISGVIAGAIGGSVFFIRNLILTGNPFAPFFAANAPHVAHYRAGAYLSDYIFDGRFIDESLGASLLSTAVATAGLTCWVLLGAGALLFLLAPSARILVPFFALPASRARIEWRPLPIAIGVAIALQLLLLGYFVDRSGTFATLAARQSDEEFLAAARPSYATITAIDGALPPSSRTLVVGLNETFWFEHRVRGGGNFDGPRVSAFLEGTPESLREKLRRDGITHVAVISAPPATQVAKKVEERETALTPSAQRSLAQMLDRYAASIAQRGNAALFALKP